MYPDAPIYASVFDRRRLPRHTDSWDLRGTLLQRLPGVRRYSRALLPLMPAAFAHLDLRAYDLIITTSSAFSKNVSPRAGVANLCYCFTPPRYLWDLHQAYAPGLRGRLAAPLVRWLRARDRKAATRVSRFVAISNTVATRIERTYERDCTVVYPPVEVERIRPNGLPPEDFFLVVSRLVSYKRVDLAVAACARLGRPLVVVGDGPERRRLERLAGPQTRFTGVLPDAEVAELFARCRALLFPGLEDFGIAPVEAQAAGRPVIAFGNGGATETVLDGETGLFFGEQSPEALASAILRLDTWSADPAACRRNAERFSADRFRTEMAAAVCEAHSSGSASSPVLSSRSGA
jgi:glycosyltransferase involved in cell wall biosynthesis